jgi:hypothetical protein
MWLIFGTWWWVTYQVPDVYFFTAQVDDAAAHTHGMCVSGCGEGYLLLGYGVMDRPDKGSGVR